jgi:hypothetical protein
MNLNQPQPVVMKVSNEMLIHITLAGKISLHHKEQLQAFADKVYTLVIDSYQKTGNKVKFLTNLTNLEAVDETFLDIYAELLKKDLPYVSKSATYGSRISILTAFSTLTIISGRMNFRHFVTREEAMDWLMSDEDMPR